MQPVKIGKYLIIIKVANYSLIIIKSSIRFVYRFFSCTIV